ncbi:MAG: M56 family metallopeptidase, partial [Oscillospiraceae bacterium]|nr:M56 family metallopeptidase [Oscillospiraceae bacterium]
MTALFITILNMSIMASVVALAVMLVRIPLKKAPKIFSYVLWGVVLFRLVCPYNIITDFSLMPIPFETIPQNIVYSQNPEAQASAGLGDVPAYPDINNALPPVVIPENVNPIIPENNDPIINAETNPDNTTPAEPESNTNIIYTVFNVAGYVWLFGFIALLSYATIGYMRLKRRVYYATLVRDNIYETDTIKTPFVLGFFNPKIYMPIGIDPAQHDYIVKHEQTHIRRCDYIIKPLAFIVFSLHWFNPFMWAAYFFMSKDIEMSCDESVLRKADEDIRDVYSSALLNLSVKRGGLLTPLAFGESAVKGR